MEQAVARTRVGLPAEVEAEAEAKADTTCGGAGAPKRNAVVRGVLFILKQLYGEWRRLSAEPFAELRRRKLFAVPLALFTTITLIVLHAIHRTAWGGDVVRVLGEVKADLPLWLSLIRTPVSLFVPALHLPVWAGITQLFLAFAMAEILLGKRRTLVIAYAATLAGTMAARIMIAIGPEHALGLPPEVGQVLDTGPSAAVVGLFTYISVVRRAPVLFILTGGSMVLESVMVPNLAGREHLIAVGAALVMGGVQTVRCRRRARLEADLHEADKVSNFAESPHRGNLDGRPPRNPTKRELKADWSKAKAVR
jgi:hypothetical protein